MSPGAIAAVGISSRVSLSQGPLDFFAELRREVAEVPPRELERIRRVEQLEGSQLDVTHPPTVYRIEYLQSRRNPTAEVSCPAAESEQIDRELAALQNKIQGQIADRYRASLYA